MKFGTALALALALAPTVSGLVTPEDIFDDEEYLKTHTWCCTDAKCPSSCDYFNGLSENPIPDGELGSDLWPEIGPGSPAPFERECYSPPLPCGGDGQKPCCNTPDFFKDWSYDQVFGNFEQSGAMYCDMVFGSFYPEKCFPTIQVVKDPHFQRWNGEWYDFHGECDLNFVNAPLFGKGAGMDVAIRTKQRHGYSFIESAAMRIGEDILEVSSWAEYKLNGVSSANLDGAHLGPFEIDYKFVNDKQQVFTIKTDVEGEVIQMKTFKDFVDVKLEGITRSEFQGATGMMGAFPTGDMLGRDGETVFEEPNEYAAEWQVRAEDPQLFSTIRAPQHPVQCILPSADAVKTRRLGEKGVSEEDAAKACEHHNESSKDMCMFDVMATGDLELASAGAY